MGERDRERASEASEVGEGAFRRAPVHDLCACGEAAGKRCLRCGVPLCRAHAPALGRRCADCEDAYASLLRDRKIHPLTGLQLTFSYLVGIGAVVGAAWLISELDFGVSQSFGYLSPRDWLMLLVAIPACLLPLIAIHWRRIRLRGSFLRERPGRQRLCLSKRALRAEEQTNLGERRPALTLGDNFATGGLILALLFFVPALPAIGLAFALIAYLGRRRHGTGARHVKIATAAIVVGVAVVGLQIWFTVAMFLRFD